ncbi:ATP-dependent helicase [Geothermobacter hydrogeniphilus]|uniref:DNA 3'-5' helicase n=1 Tax=Geothermobacter hydrogeniphilus TaxID=1969733 RepID=A0A1X0Y0E6_9BACT|nr:UvrD-helicase domain-containing protein [Geothermobacter hydrogeniphilus]ORJ58586.1 ATP-dependent DNA helicase Rep [Geothermobacter hydrogeniphilus]
MVDFHTLNPEQYAAVEHGDGPLLLLAGAGSGKTRVITYRIAYLVLERDIHPGHILAMTFTNKAALEMRERVAGLIGRKRTAAMTIATFHSLCVQILKQHIDRLGYKRNFSIYAAADQVRLIKDLIDRHVNSGDRRIDADRILWIISDAKNRLIAPEDFVPFHGDEYQLAAATVYPAYQKALKAFNAVDFDDLIMLTTRLFRDHPEALEACRQCYRYLLVDEYQDTNAAQYQLLRQLAAHGNLCVVGDDDQSIYGWRGADLGNILDFEKDFPGTRTIRLEQNYRSTGNILAAANAVIRCNTRRKVKKLWTADGAGEPLEMIVCRDEEDEALQVVERLQVEHYRGRPWKHFAILYRTNIQSRAFEEQLRYLDVPYRLVGGQQFYDRKEVKDAVAYLKVLLNPSDEVNLLRILNYPKRGIGTTSADRLIQRSSDRDCSLWEVLRDPSGVDLSDQVRASLALFVRLIETWRYRLRDSLDLTASVAELFRELDLDGEINRSTDDRIKAERRREFLQDVINALASYQQREAEPTLAGFLEKVSLLDDEQQDDKDADEEDVVTLMSLHSSKGLEFPMVFLVGMEEEYLPHKNSLEAAADGGEATAPIEEERRLFYVGITRARRQLVLTRAEERKKYGKALKREPSRFLAEIPEELLQARSSSVPRQTSEAEQQQQAGHFFSGIQSLLGE